MPYEIDPDEIEGNAGDTPKLQPGKYICKLTRAIHLEDNGATLLVFEEGLGKGEIVERITWENFAESIPAHPQFWRRAVAALDIPDQAYWDGDRGKRPWDKVELEEAVGTEVFVQVAQKGEYMNVVDLKSPRRHPSCIGECADDSIPF